MLQLKLFDNALEDVTYNFTNFPIRAQKALLSNYLNMRAINHWHKDLEFIISLKGKISYSINGKDYLIKEGQAIFVNSEQMHYGYSSDGSDCTFICILLPPTILSCFNYIYENFILQIFNDKSHPFFIFDSSIEWQKEFINTLLKLYNICSEKKDGFELNAMSYIFSICSILFNNVKADITQCENLVDKNITTLHNMIGFIQENYSKKITLKDIAAAGNVCRSSCCEIFKTILNKSPFIYLTEYRLEKSTELLINSFYSITEVALQCGFSNSSYFTETFHKYLGYTPSEYRKKSLIKK